MSKSYKSFEEWRLENFPNYTESLQKIGKNEDDSVLVVADRSFDRVLSKLKNSGFDQIET